ncbi:hypothetical protein NL108_009624, partial [Boleophthalmus pectinirostris]
VEAELNSNATLHCHVEPEGPITKEDYVEWCRVVKEGDNKTVHVYRNGNDYPDEQDADFRGRTKMLNDSLKNGNILVQIYNVMLNDSGTYKCSV